MFLRRCYQHASKAIKQVTYQKYITTKRCLQTSAVCGCQQQQQQGTSASSSQQDNLNKSRIKQVLHFFNNCDHVTLLKLMRLKPRYFKDIDTQKVIRTGRISLRFPTIESLLAETQIDSSWLENIAKLITSLHRKENTSFGVKNIYPKFPQEKIQDVDQVVSLDVFHNNVLWTVQKPDRTVTDFGSATMFEDSDFNFVYKHDNHHQEIARVVQMIPLSNVYLIHSRQQTRQGKGNIKFQIHQAQVEAILITLLNSRRQYSVEEILNTNLFRDSAFGEEKNENFYNKVYMFDIMAFAEFYNTVMQNELLLCQNTVKNWMEDKKGPLIGMKMDEELQESFLKHLKVEQLSKCLLMSDIFCKCLLKGKQPFPRAYSGD